MTEIGRAADTGTRRPTGNVIVPNGGGKYLAILPQQHYGVVRGETRKRIDAFDKDL